MFSCNKYFFQFVALIIGVFVSPAVSAVGLIEWQSANVQLLRGWDYEVGDEKRTLATFEYANSWKYGDFFMFADFTWPDDGGFSYYAEFSPRFSLKKVMGGDFQSGLIEDILIATTLEKPESQKVTYLYGLGVDLGLADFQFFNINAYVRDDPSISGQTYQVTVAWKRLFAIGGFGFVVEGFADFAGKEGGSASNELIVPRLLMDVGEIVGMEEDKLWMGVEWQYWHNKFGIRGVTESVFQLQTKLVF